MKDTDRMPFIQPIGPNGKPIVFVPYDFSNWESDRLKYYLKRIEEMKTSKEKYDIAKKVVEQYEAADKANKIKMCKHEDWTNGYMSNSQSVHYYKMCLECGHTFDEYEEPA